MDGHHFVLVHGLGHGAWCWFKVSALLQAQGHTVTALDLASSGIHKAAADSITSVADYLAPLTHFLAHSLPASSQVIMVGHSLGGSSISYAMELFPEKICKAIFVCGLMPASGSAFLPFQSLTALLDARAFIFKNGSKDGKELSDAEPTSIHTDNTKCSKVFYNKCSLEDKILASNCLNPTPFVVVKETISLSTTNYGRIPRFYIKCSEDRIFSTNDQDTIINENLPCEVFCIPQSDHSPFFSCPNALVELLLTIAQK